MMRLWKGGQVSSGCLWQTSLGLAFLTLALCSYLRKSVRTGLWVGCSNANLDLRFLFKKFGHLASPRGGYTAASGVAAPMGAPSSLQFGMSTLVLSGRAQSGGESWGGYAHRFLRGPEPS